MHMSLSKLRAMVKDKEAGVLESMRLQRVRHDSDWTTAKLYNSKKVGNVASLSIE